MELQKRQRSECKYQIEIICSIYVNIILKQDNCKFLYKTVANCSSLLTSPLTCSACSSPLTHLSPSSLSCPLQTILMSNYINLHVFSPPHLRLSHTPSLPLAMQSNCALGRFNCNGLDLRFNSRYINPAPPFPQCPPPSDTSFAGLPIDPVTAYPIFAAQLGLLLLIKRETNEYAVIIYTLYICMYVCIFHSA